MKKHSLRSAAAFGLSAAVIVISFVAPGGAARQTPGARAREEAYRANNLGVALLEQFKHGEGAEQFRRALALDPKLALARTNLAIALYNVPDLLAAQEAARAAAEAAPDAPQPHYILGLVARQQNRAEDAVASFRRVLQIDPRDVGALVQLGQLYAQQRKYAEAVASLRAAVAEEPYNGTALYNLGTALLRSGAREEGQRIIQQFQTLRESGAATTVGQNYLEQGRYAEAVISTGLEPGLVDKATPEVSFSDATGSSFPAAWTEGWPLKGTTLEQIDGGVLLFDYDGDGDLDLLEVASVAQRLYRNDGGRFADVTARTGALAKEAGGVGMGAVAGDFDNDGRTDLFVLRHQSSALYRNEGSGRFADVTAAARIPAYPHLPKSAAFVDYDHDGDLDLFIAGGSDAADTLKFEASVEKARREGTQKPSNTLYSIGVRMPPAPSLLLRNNGDGTFSDQTAAAKFAGVKVDARAVVPSDYDNRRDVDLLVAADGGVALWRNMRDGTFRDVAAEVGLGGDELKAPTNVAAGDVNKDGFTDFYFGKGAWAGYFAMSDGRGRFRLVRGPGELTIEPSSPKAKFEDASQLLDYDNDGLLDLVSAVTASESPAQMRLRIWRNTGDGWTEVSERVSPALKSEVTHTRGPRPGGRVLASGDVDGDGDTDLVFGIPGGGLKLARNEGGNRNASVRVSLAGKVSNRSGVGAKIEMRAGSLQQKLETYAASPAPAPSDVVFGLGRRERADAVRVLWPSGVVQAETEFAADTRTPPKSSAVTLPVTELDRKPSSCPYLYAWDGERFRFITDFMGGGELGYWAAPGVRAAPDPDEYVRIPPGMLKEKNGRFELRVTNELEEALFIDRLQLVAVAHPPATEVFPNEGLGNPTSKTFKLYTTMRARPPLAAVDGHGHDVLERIRFLDRTYPDDFTKLPLRGYAEEHTLTLKLGGEGGPTKYAGQTLMDDEGRVSPTLEYERPLDPSTYVLLLTGWTDYAFSSDNVAAAQRGLGLKPPALQVKDREGNWRTVIEDIGIPVGRPQTVAVELKGKFLSSSRDVRIVTNMRIYWDQILLDTSGGSRVRVERLDASSADLRWRGFSAEVTPDGREPFAYDYARVSAHSPWKVLPGRYTREGDVRTLLARVDDIFVVSRPGDEVALSFDARRLAPLPKGWARTFLLYADGFSKEMDINSASPHEVAPLPFHAMKQYPYAAPERYPRTPAHRAYLERYNTRVVTAPLPQMSFEFRVRSPGSEKSAP